MKPKTTAPDFLRPSANGLYTLPRSLRKLCTDPSIEPDVISEQARARRYEIVSNPCPECGGAVQEWFDPVNPFSKDDPLPRALARCVDCEYTYDPKTGVVVETAKPWKVEEELPIIKPSED